VTQGDLSQTPANNSYTVDNKGKLLANNTPPAPNKTEDPPQAKPSSNSSAGNQSPV